MWYLVLCLSEATCREMGVGWNPAFKAKSSHITTPTTLGRSHLICNTWLYDFQSLPAP